MCIRDSHTGDAKYLDIVERVIYNGFLSGVSMTGDRFFYPCLLYTSDAADERSSVDLGGRRIIKKKKRLGRGWRSGSETT